MMEYQQIENQALYNKETYMINLTLPIHISLHNSMESYEENY